MSPRVITYKTVPLTVEVPDNMRACATLIPEGSKTPTWTAHAATPEEAEAKVRAFYAGELDRYGRPKAPVKRGEQPAAEEDVL